jgi:MYXO-CTERM domain-containing protein
LTGAAPAYIDFVTGGDTSSPDATYPVTQVFAHPSYDPDTTQNDIALAYVHGVQATSPPSYNCASLSGYGSSSVTKVGYGAGNAEPLTGIGIKRRASMEIGGIDQSSIGYQFDGTGPCHGDAGAPSLLEMSGSERLVGLTSTFADGCVGSSSDTRVDAYCNWIQGRLGEDAPDECRLLADECGDDTCVPVAEDAAYCVASEGVGADTACDPADTDWSDGLACADGLVCASVDADTDACRPICTKDADCADDEECVTPIFGVDTAGACLPCTDADEDGFCEDVDCDDSQADINPDAIEVCDDDLDNDCNGDVDGDDPACQTPGDTGVDAGADVGPDAGRDTGTQPDIGDKGATGGDKGGTDGGCNCTSGGPATPAGPVMLVLAGLVALRTRRR